MLMHTDRTAATAGSEAGRQGQPAVQLDGVTKRYGESIALHEAWLKIRPAEFMTLLGPSGCGKTTLLNLVAGFLEADGGEIFIEGTLVTETPAHQREIGIVFQNYALFPHMSVANNIAYGLKTRGIGRKEIARRVDEALALVRLDGFSDRKPRQLSGGQQQRVALARALVIKPKVLLLDEPFSALDKNLRGSMQVELKQIQRELGVTTIFVTHDQGEALSMSDRIAVMSAGRIRQIAAPGDVYCRPADRFVASFVGNVNVLTGRLVERRGEAATVSVGKMRLEVPAAPLAKLAVGDDVDVFIRPEHLAVTPGTAPGSLRGTVTTQVFQGDHIDLYIEIAGVARAPVLLRAPGIAALSSCPAGAEVGLIVGSDDVVAFPPEARES
ncbi:ABC transporter ATP-binding protein [Bradyrhizobium sp. CCBAU 51765]|uniref:ABC transporter ATP-binding protein n=1 Tax=Bradyrhizobium sp. CCBAU 51765 TaxID=1325102 RepID=UPI00188796E9|nr:ABC transporter ATP-binding protein [Bradyrhizobium sp. CCBAU 51765]QOZ08091.1 ABC transporter ATP-binding protein [Bradyrhizobium sp. CCBAU 51765]